MFHVSCHCMCWYQYMTEVCVYLCNHLSEPVALVDPSTSLPPPLDSLLNPLPLHFRAIPFPPSPLFYFLPSPPFPLPQLPSPPLTSTPLPSPYLNSPPLPLTSTPLPSPYLNSPPLPSPPLTSTPLPPFPSLPLPSPYLNSPPLPSPPLYAVGPQTASTVYTDDFFQSLDVVVNALDNIETRRYMDR